MHEQYPIMAEITEWIIVTMLVTGAGMVILSAGAGMVLIYYLCKKDE